MPNVLDVRTKEYRFQTDQFFIHLLHILIDTGTVIVLDMSPGRKVLKARGTVNQIAEHLKSEFAYCRNRIGGFVCLMGQRQGKGPHRDTSIATELVYFEIVIPIRSDSSYSTNCLTWIVVE